MVAGVGAGLGDLHAVLAYYGPTEAPSYRDQPT